MTGSTSSSCVVSGKIASLMYLGLPTATLTLSSPPPAASSATLVCRQDEETVLPCRTWYARKAM